jgi:SLT domain-containing protein
MVKLPKWIPGIGGKGINIPEIPNLAAGGIVTSPTIARIGEAGPEAVIPLGGGGGGGMMPSITINFPVGSTVIMDNEASARALADQITQQIRSVLRAQGSF